MKHGKKYLESLKKYDSSAALDLVKACETVKELKFAKFDETVEVHVNLRLGKKAVAEGKPLERANRVSE